MITNTILPCDTEAELALIVKCVLQPDTAIDVIARLEVEDFYNEKLKVIYNVIKNLTKQGTPSEMFAVRDQLKEQSLRDYLIEIVNAGIDWRKGDTDLLISIIKKKSDARNVIGLCRDLELAAYQDNDDILTELISKTMRLNQMDKDASSFDAKELTEEFFGELSEISEGKKKETTKFGFIDLDSDTGGVRPSSLVIIAGRPSQGKSAFLDNVATNMMDLGKSIYFVSAESSRQELMGRMIGRISGLGYSKLNQGIKSDPEWQSVNEAMERFNKYTITINDNPSITTDQILVEASRLKLKGELDVILVDYLQFLKDKVKGDFEERRIAQISINLKTIARKLNVPVIAACQLNREVTGREDKDPRLSDLRYSGQIEQDADLVIGLWRENEETQMTNFKILKQRNGRLGKFILSFNGDLCRFNDL